MPQNALTITFVTESPLWKHARAQGYIRAALKSVWPRVAEGNGRLVICLSDDARVHVLNKQFRGKDRPTNVLSFAGAEGDDIGQLIIAHETVTREAAGENKSFRDHLTHLCLHGLLHVIGYDHETEDEAEEMEALEVKLLKSLGIDNPYAAVQE